MAYSNYKPKKIVSDSVWDKKDNAMDAAVALKGAIELLKDKEWMDLTKVLDVADEIFYWLRQKREGDFDEKRVKEASPF